MGRLDDCLATACPAMGAGRLQTLRRPPAVVGKHHRRHRGIAGTGAYAPFTNTSEQQFDEMIQVHLNAPFFLTKHLLPLLADGGRILNVSYGWPASPASAMPRTPLLKARSSVLTRYQAQELGEHRIRVNTLVPGAVATDFGGGSSATTSTSTPWTRTR